MKKGYISDSEVGREGCVRTALHRAHRESEGEETVSALKETEVEYKKGAYYCHMMAAMPNNVV
jgi:DNA-directed RNA polymerase beta' subunit